MKNVNKLNKYLQAGEIILWYQMKVTNWYYLRRKILYVSSIILSIFLIIWFIAMLDFLLPATVILSTLITLNIFVVPYLISDYIKIKGKQLRVADLKNYERFVILTNKRFIRKHFFLNSQKSLLQYSEQVLEHNKDIAYLNLDCVEGIIVNYPRKAIFLLIGKEKLYFESYWDVIWTHFFIHIPKGDINELKVALAKLKKILPLEMKEKDIKLNMEVYIVAKD